MEKKITLEQNINALKWTHEAKLATIVQLVIGMPGETDKTIDETTNFLINTIDYYNENPSGVNVIEKMNEELAQVQKENDELKKTIRCI